MDAIPDVYRDRVRRLGRCRFALPGSLLRRRQQNPLTARSRDSMKARVPAPLGYGAPRFLGLRFTFSCLRVL